jgi:hypothetical protein
MEPDWWIRLHRFGKSLNGIGRTGQVLGILAMRKEADGTNAMSTLVEAVEVGNKSRRMVDHSRPTCPCPQSHKGNVPKALDILQVQAERDSRIRSEFGSPSAVRREATAMRMGWKFVFSGGRSATRQVKVRGRRLFPTDVSCGVSTVKSSIPVLVLDGGSIGISS